MKIKIGSLVVAGATLKESPADLTINGQRLIDEAEFCRAESPDFYDRGNERTIVEFNVWRLHETLEEADIFMLDHAKNIPAVADVTLQIEDADGSVVGSRFIKQASCQSVDRRQKGVSTYCRYRIVGGVIVNSLI